MINLFLPIRHLFTTRSIMDQSMFQATDRVVAEEQDIAPAILLVLTTQELTDVPAADMRETLSLMKATSQVNQRTNLTMLISALSSSRKQPKGVRSLFHSGEEMVRRRDAATANLARRSGSPSALPALWSLTAMFAPQFALTEPSTTRASVLSKATMSSRSATQMRNLSMENATGNAPDKHQNIQSCASASALWTW